MSLVRLVLEIHKEDLRKNFKSLIIVAKNVFKYIHFLMHQALQFQQAKPACAKYFSLRQ